MNKSGSDTILLIDEDRAWRNSLAKVLKASGFNVLQSASIKEAAVLATRRSVSLILVDFVPSSYRHFTVLSEFISKIPDTPVIAFVLYNDPSSAKRMRSLGVAACLTKPVRRYELLSAIRNALAQKSQK